MKTLRGVTIFRRNVLIPFALGFFSVYLVWVIWGEVFHWEDRNETIMWTYAVGDRALLATFSGIVYALAWGSRNRISQKALLLSMIFIPIATGAFIASYEPDSHSLITTGGVRILTGDPGFADVVQEVDTPDPPEWLVFIHIAFIFYQLCLVGFACVVYALFSPETGRPFLPVSAAFLLLALFLALAFWPDDWASRFALWQKTLSISLLWGVWILFVLDKKFGFIEKPLKKFQVKKRTSM